MNVLLMLIPFALTLSAIGLAAFLWALRHDQFDDLDGAAHRILFDDLSGEETPEETPPIPHEREEDRFPPPSSPQSVVEKKSRLS